MEKTKTIFDDDSCLEFQTTHKTIDDFLDPQINSANKILHVKTQEAETEFVSMQIYKKLSTAAVNKDTYIMMKTSFSEENFERGVKVFEKSESFKFMIIEVNSEDCLFDARKKSWTNFSSSSLKRLIVITDVNSKIVFSGCSELEVSSVYPKDVSIDSLAKVLSRRIEFQKIQTSWKELAEEDFLKNNVFLKDLLRKKAIAENVQVFKEFDNKNLYVPRTFLCQHWLKTEVLNVLNSDEIVNNQQDYEAMSKSKSIHWLEKIGGNLKWMKSSNNITEILKFIDKRKEEPIGEDLFLDSTTTTRISILIDVAGMGKSTILNYLAQLLKKANPNFWIIKIDLNDCTNELEKIGANELQISEKAVEFLIEQIFKLKSDIEKNLFKNSCVQTGKITLLFDGFDEVASYYKDQVTQLIKSLLKTSVGKVFIASRPEWAEHLQTTFLQIKYSLMPFEKQDQGNYLFSFMMQKIENVDEDLLKKIVQMILSSMSESLNDEVYKFTGVPLITKLVAEFFESKIRDHLRDTISNNFDDIAEKLRNETFNLVKLYDHFVEKKLRIYYEEKSGMDLSKPQIKKTVRQGTQIIMENYETLAVQQILKSDVAKHFPIRRKTR
jgi:energy-coupling factor transporter ATP-binding protein EcfA2